MVKKSKKKPLTVADLEGQLDIAVDRPYFVVSVSNNGPYEITSLVINKRNALGDEVKNCAELACAVDITGFSDDDMTFVWTISAAFDIPRLAAFHVRPGGVPAVRLGTKSNLKAGKMWTDTFHHVEGG